jgi:ribosome biogenesis GTPase / thiamine phosphate phosphatase
LARKSLMKRRNAGTERKIQNIAANMDTVFIVTSCNHDFNPARLERYIALAFEAEVTPVIILTKADLCDNADDYLQQALSISPTVFALTLNAHDTDVKRLLADWCGIGQSVAFLGSSGVGKSTLVNQLRGDHVVETQSIREQDSKGRHTTTSRQLHLLADGFVVIDTPGMRELQMSDVASGIAQLFDDLQTLSETCRFADCVHESEPGCAIQQGVTSGEIDPKRVARWQKLAREEAFNTASLAERRSKDKAFGKMVRRVIKDKKKTRS